MADVVSAGTFVGSVLEHMGYLTQARFLEQFQSFFRDAGALIYLLAGAGAVVSVAMFGSFRGAQYLLAGPAFFWFLIGPTTETEGVLWKLGGGSYLGELRSQGRGAAEDFRDEVLRKVKEDKNNGGGSGSIEVAIGFWLFAWPINEFVNEFVDQMLDKEDTEDLTANHKVGGLELIAAAIPYESNHINRLENFVAGCGNMFASASAAAQLMARQRANGAVGGTGANAGLQAEIDGHLAQVKHYADNSFISTRNNGFKELIEGQVQAGTSQVAPDLVDGNNVAIESITCGSAWALVAEETWHTAGREVPRVLRLASGVWEFSDSLDYTCRELTRKTFDDEGQDCNLRPGITLFLLYNQLTRMDTFGRVLGRHWNQRDPINPQASTIMTGPMYENFKPFTDERGRQITRRRTTAYGTDTLEVLLQRPGVTGPQNEQAVPTYMWAPMSSITALHGMDHAMWVATRQYEVVKLRQEIYTYSMQLPYYQGVCLYFIAVTYPFMALIVLLPGRASNFMNVPMAWLWVKSWDIGFAAVIIVDKVMYNLLPNWNIEGVLREGPWFEPELFAHALAQGYNYDPMASLHIYYTVISMLTLSIPVLTGAFTLRARRGILSAFTDAPAAQARDRADAAGGSFSIMQQSARTHMMSEVAGYARMSSIGGDGDVGGGLRGTSAQATAVMFSGGKVISGADLTKMVRMDPAQIATLPETAIQARENYLSNFASQIGTQAKFDAAIRGGYDKMLGRSGMIQMYQEAYASAMDGGGGFELSNHDANAIDEFISSFTSKIKVATSTAADITKSGGSKFLTAAAKDPAALLMLATPTGVALAQNGGLDNFSVTDLKNSLGAEAYTDEEFLARVFHIDRFTFNDPTIRAAAEQSPLFSKVYDTFSQPAPGGVSSPVDIYLAAGGGDRFLGAPPGVGAVAAENNAVVFRTPELPPLTYLEQADDWNKSFQQYLGNMMLMRQDQYTMRLEADRDLQRQFPGGVGVYQHETESSRRQLIAHLGGSEAVAELWNAAGFPNRITAAEAEALTPPQLAELALRLNQASHTALNDEITKQFKGNAIDARSATVMTGELSFYSLPTDMVNVEGGQQPAMVYLAHNNPLLAMQMITEWHSRLAHGTPVQSTIAPGITEDGYMTPTTFYRK